MWVCLAALLGDLDAAAARHVEVADHQVGRARAMTSIASSASAASPTTWKLLPRSLRRPDRQIWWSSATTTRTAPFDTGRSLARPARARPARVRCGGGGAGRRQLRGRVGRRRRRGRAAHRDHRRVRGRGGRVHDRLVTGDGLERGDPGSGRAVARRPWWSPAGTGRSAPPPACWPEATCLSASSRSAPSTTSPRTSASRSSSRRRPRSRSAGAVRAVDVAEVNGRCFVNNSSLGVYPAMVGIRDRIREERGWGKVRAAPVAAWRVLRRFPVRRLHITRRRLRGGPAHPVRVRRQRPLRDRTRGRGRAERARSGRGLPLRGPGRLASQARGRRTAVRRARLDRGAASSTSTARAEILVSPRHHRLSVAVDGEVVTLRSPLRYRSRPPRCRCGPAPRELGRGTDRSGRRRRRAPLISRVPRSHGVLERAPRAAPRCRGPGPRPPPPARRPRTSGP